MSEKNNIIAISKSFESEMIERDKRSKKLAWVIAVSGVMVGMLGLVAVITMLPLKQTTVDLYTVDNTTGRVEKITTVNNMDMAENEVMNKYFASLYVKTRERYNYFSLQNDYEKTQVYGTDDVNKDYLKLFSSDNAPDVIYQKANTVVYIHVISNTISAATQPDNLSTIRFKKTIRKVRDGTMTIEYWVARTTFRYLPHKELTEEQRENNPLGFTVTSYQLDKEMRGE